MADYVLYSLILAIAVIATKYSVPFILSIARIPHHLVAIVNLVLYFAIFTIIIFTLYFLPQPRNIIFQIFTRSETTPITVLASVTPIPTNTPVSTNTPVPTNTPVSTNTPVPTNTPIPTIIILASPTNTPTPKLSSPTLTRTPTKTPTRKPDQPTRTPYPQSTPTVPPDMGMIILQGSSGLGGLETQVQWLDGASRWNNVENWRGPLDNAGRISWLVWSKDFNAGPFRWLVHNRDGRLRFESQSFHLPSAGYSYLISIN